MPSTLMRTILIRFDPDQAGWCLERNLDPARAVEALRPVVAAKIFDAHGGSGLRRMHELPFAEVDADVRVRTPERVVEDEIAGLEIFRAHGDAGLALSDHRSRHADSVSLLVDVSDEPAAVEPS